MGKVTKAIDGTRTFVGEVRTELYKSAWPTRNELYAHTIAVVVFVVILSTYVGLSDWVLLKVIRALVQTMALS